jgi:transmembrane sensor
VNQIEIWKTFVADRAHRKVNFTDLHGDDRVWRAAVEWVMREHESPLNGAAEKELFDWLESDPAHRAAYEEASYLWMLTGLVPRSDGSKSDG